MSESISKDSLIELSQLRWHCRRGVKELDVVLRSYLDKHYIDSSESAKEAFLSLLNLEDPILMSLIVDHDEIEVNESQRRVLSKMKNPYSL